MKTNKHLSINFQWDRFIKKTLSFCAAIAVIGYAFYKKDLIVDALLRTNGYWVAGGVCIYYMNYLFRAKRFVTLSNGKILLYPNAVYASSLHGIAAYFMPVRSGDLTLPLILKSISGLELTQGGRILVKARLLDISVLGIFTFIAAVFSYGRFSIKFTSVWLISGLAMILCFSIIKIVGSKLSAFTSRYSDKITRIITVDPATLPEIFLSAAIWLFIGLGYYCAAMAVGLDISFFDIWLLVTLQLPLQLFPVQGIANAGNHELGWVAGLILLGIPPDQAIQFAITSHAVLIVYVLVLGIPLLLAKSRLK